MSCAPLVLIAQGGVCLVFLVRLALLALSLTSCLRFPVFLVATLLACKLNVHYALLEGELDWVVNRYIHFIRVFVLFFPPEGQDWEQEAQCGLY